MNCLVVGRTPLDVEECRAYGLPDHNPAPSTLEWDSFGSFNGDIITCHTIKYGAKYACAVETSKRVQDSARKYPGQVIVGESELHKVPEGSGLEENAIVLNHSYDFRYPDMNSGVFALWFAFRMGYRNIYTIGIDLRKDATLLEVVQDLIRKHPDQNLYKMSQTSHLNVPVLIP